MAEMITNVSGKNGRAAKFQIPRVDLTPMVDLGFLLLTFFVFSSTMSQPNALKAIYPDDRITNSPTTVKKSGALTLLLGNNNEVYYYEGLTDEQGKSWKSTNIKSIRPIIVSKKNHTQNDDFVVLIKPSNSSDYSNLVSILDEMNISMVERYSISDISPQEQLTIDNKEKATFSVK